MKLIIKGWKRFLKESSQEEKIKRLLFSDNPANVNQGLEVASMLLPEFEKAERLTLLYFKAMFDEVLDNKQVATALQAVGPEAISQIADLLDELKKVSSPAEFKGWAQNYIRIAGQLINNGVAHHAVPLTFYSMVSQYHGEEEEFNLEAIVGPEDLFEKHYLLWFLKKILSGEKLTGWFGNLEKQIAVVMKENWEDVSPKQKAIYEFMELASLDEVKTKDFMFHLETKTADDAMEASNIKLDEVLTEKVYNWIDRWYAKKELMEASKMKISKSELQQIINEELEMILLEEGVMDWFRSKPDLSQITLDEPAEEWSLEREMQWDPYKDLLLPKEIEGKITRIMSNYETDTGRKDLDIIELLKKALKSQNVDLRLLSVKNDVLTWSKTERNEITPDSPGYGNQFNLGDIFWSKVTQFDENTWDWAPVSVDYEQPEQDH
tara:strand:- start:3294 stop:4601 length:1308 start_codon:yes stop_codon:yes gene_type:complete